MIPIEVIHLFVNLFERTFCHVIRQSSDQSKALQQHHGTEASQPGSVDLPLT